MSQKLYYAQRVRVANFSSISLPADYLLSIPSEDPEIIVKEIRRYADLPYVFLVDKTWADAVSSVLTTLKNMRSRCYPYAVFLLDEAMIPTDLEDIDIINVDHPLDGDIIASQIDAYAATLFKFDHNRLKVDNMNSPPSSTDVIIVGAGITGLYAGNRLEQSGIAYTILDRREKVGGIWSQYANTTSRVNSSEAAYRLIENGCRANRDHSATREILQDIAMLSGTLARNIYLNTEVTKITKVPAGYQVEINKNGDRSILTSKGIILAINDRVGPPREIEWLDEAKFRGEIVTGTSDKAIGVDWRDKQVVVVGMGAFAIENVRTALEGGARHVTVLCRRHGTICPKIIDYLNFATPYDEKFKHDKKSNIRNMIYWKKLYDLSGATNPECWMGKVKHPGHTISVSDIWFIAHYLKKVKTVTGVVDRMYENGVITNRGERINADVVINCIGFERNTSAAKSLTEYDATNNINYLDKDFMYLADAYIDDNAFNSFFGSSVLEMVKFYIEVYIKAFNSSAYEEMTSYDGIYKVDITQRAWTDYIKGAEVLINNDQELKKAAQQQVDQRTRNFLEQHDLETYIAENKREWMDLHTLLAGKPMTEEECLPYVFEKLLQ